MLTGKGDSSEEVQAKYQRNLKQSQARIQRMASQAPHVGQILAAIVRAFIAACKNSIGMRRIVPGRTKSWWNENIETAIATRRELHKTMRKLGTQQWRDAYQSQRRLAKQLVCQAKQQHQIDRENTINTQSANKVNDKSNLGEKPLWNEIQREPGFKNYTPPRAPQAMRQPDTGILATTPEGVLEAQVAHTPLLGSQHALHGANPHFDVQHEQHVTSEVLAYQHQNGALYHSRNLPGCMNDPITVDEILKALSQLKNGKAASPVTGIPNELLKYEGTPAAQLLLPILNMFWESGQTPDQWREGVM
jgi:hypothetical protein